MVLSVHSPSASSGQNSQRLQRTSTLVTLTPGTTVLALHAILARINTFSQLLNLSGRLLSHIVLSTLRSSSTLKCLAIIYSSSQTLIAAWKSRRTHVVCACCTLKHSLALDPVNSCHPLGLCHPVSHGPDSGWDCRRVLHWIPPNELDRHGPTGRGLHPSQCTQPCKCFNAAISQAVSPAFNSAISLPQS